MMLLWCALFAAVACGHDLATIRRLFPRAFHSAAALAAAMPEEAREGSATVFRLLDKDGDGVVTRTEMEKAFPMTLAAEGGLRQSHLSLGGAWDMWIMWVTDSKLAGPFVRWGSSPSQLSHNATGTSHTYNVGLFGWHKWLHQAAMTGLAPDQKVFFQYGHAGGDTSAVSSFQMPGLTTASIAFLADQGTIEPLGNAVAQQIGRDAQKQRVDAVHIAGDLAYAWKSATPGPEEQWIWDLYQQEQTAYALRVPQMVTIGNHEQFANATAFANRYRMATGGGGVPPFYYSYNVGPVHIVAFTTDGPPGYAAGSPQLAWLASDLAAVDRSVTPWVVFTTHRPLYCSAIMEFGEHADEAKVIEPLLLAGKVDLVVTGHVHVYERILPNIGGKPVVSNATSVFRAPGAPAYVVQGTGGCLLDLSRNEWEEPQAAWSSVRNRAHYGYALMTANATHLHYAFRLERDNSIFDQMWLLK